MSHRFTISATLVLPFGEGQRWLARGVGFGQVTGVGGFARSVQFQARVAW